MEGNEQGLIEDKKIVEDSDNGPLETSNLAQKTIRDAANGKYVENNLS